MPQVPDWIRSLMRDINEQSEADVGPTEKTSALPAVNDGQVVIAAPVAPPAATATSAAVQVEAQAEGPTSEQAGTSVVYDIPALHPEEQIGTAGRVTTLPDAVPQGVVGENAAPAEQAAQPGEQTVRLVRLDEEEPLLDSHWAFFMVLGTGAGLAAGAGMRPDQDAEERRHRRPRAI